MKLYHGQGHKYGWEKSIIISIISAKKIQFRRIMTHTLFTTVVSQQETGHEEDAVLSNLFT